MPNHLNVHHACHRVADEMRGCWANLILVPASQYQTLAASLAWIKQKRDTALKSNLKKINHHQNNLLSKKNVRFISRILKLKLAEVMNR